MSEAARRAAVSPLYGRPTHDGHLLIDDEQIGDGDRHLVTQYVHSPARRTSLPGRKKDTATQCMSSVHATASLCHTP